MSKIGEIRVMKCGEEAEIIEYKNNSYITIKFLKTGELINCRYEQFKNGTVKSHFTPTVYGVGIVGLEITATGGRNVKPYIKWCDMLKRCYDKKEHRRYPKYKSCTVCDEWLYYPNFKKWYEENYYEIEGQKMTLDKDILIKGNKVYSPDTCMIVPSNINVMFTNSSRARGKYPIGVNYREKEKGKFRARCSVFNKESQEFKRKNLGLYNTPEEAFQVYKSAKEKSIKDVADYYKEQIPEKLYNAMYNYKVEITD
ncbi:MAG: hypothetical protein E7H33_09585 [Clostridium perfringens]|nr:hypothetical protein [Clostridium perfringens]